MEPDGMSIPFQVIPFASSLPILEE